MELSEKRKKELRIIFIGLFTVLFLIGMFVSKIAGHITNTLDSFIITIPEEERVYTEAFITKVEKHRSGENIDYDVYGILKNDEEEKERELNFYYTGLAQGDTIEVYYKK